MKVSELAKEMNKTNKEVLEVLASLGVEAKAFNSSISDEDAQRAKASFEPKKETSKAAPKAEPPKADTSKVEAKADAPKADAPKEDAPKADAPKAEAPKADGAKVPQGNRPQNQGNNVPKNPQQGQQEPPKKKKNIIFVANTGNSGMSGNKPNQQKSQGPRPGQASSRPGANQVPHKIIKPITAPSAVSAASDFKENARRLDEVSRSRNEKNSADRNFAEKNSADRNVAQRNASDRNSIERNASERNNADAQAVKVAVRTENEGNERVKANGPDTDNKARRDGGQKNFPANGNQKRDNRRGYDNSGAQGGPKGQNDRFKQDNQKPQAGINDNAPGSGKEDKRRSSIKDQSKRSKKDLIYEDENESRQSKVGKFNKPEKKVEEVVEDQIKVITIPEVISIKDLADKMKLQPAAIIKKLFMQGQIVTVNTEVSYEEAENIAMEYDILCEQEVKVDVIEELLKEEEEDASKLVSRPPVICVMGHVDHGKTSLLDAIRKTNVTDKEAGGITQHIGAYTVNIKGQSITFLDTPGHEAFTAMRMRGANSTDIAVLVVAADDGVMPQTVEAISHAKAAGIEIIVAVNKIDKPGANIDRVKQEMTEHELIPVDWGGNTEFVPVSAKSGEGIENLLETILLTAEIMELKANPNRLARGLVIEAELDKGRGPVARLLVQKGTLHVGDYVSAGAAHGRVRAMIDDKGRRVKSATPSTPVEILGLSDVPSAGEVFISHDSDKTAKQYADTYIAQNKEKKVEETKSKMSLDDLFNQIQSDNLKELNIIVKADVQGSVEAVKQSLTKLSNDEVVVKCIHGGVGAINESDVVLASASSAIIIGFNVRPDAQAKAISEREGVEVRLYRVIYQAIEDIENAMKGMLDPIFEEKVIGHAEVRQIFKASAIGNIAGSKVMDGMFQRNCLIRITRDGEQIYEGKLASLKRFKDDVKEVKEGYECGLVFEDFDQMQELDWVEAYIMVEVPR